MERRQSEGDGPQAFRPGRMVHSANDASQGVGPSSSGRQTAFGVAFRGESIRFRTRQGGWCYFKVAQHFADNAQGVTLLGAFDDRNQAAVDARLFGRVRRVIPRIKRSDAITFSWNSPRPSVGVSRAPRSGSAHQADHFAASGLSTTSATSNSPQSLRTCGPPAGSQPGGDEFSTASPEPDPKSKQGSHRISSRGSQHSVSISAARLRRIPTHSRALWGSASDPLRVHQCSVGPVRNG